ncbi:MAG: hypothetical protein A2Y86_05220 [Candidatus Aminicenantes bacterium RBG_13_62_12]|nr:MAG: hypothetical protein A2Y86_05220 [Candidatus Aminicenantes bacterium RBG_13_62_12]
MRQEIWIPLLMPSNNKLLRMHRQTYKRLLWSVMWGIKASCDVPEGRPINRRRVTIIAHVKKRLDDDNFQGGLKPLLDALQNLNFIRTDHPRWIDKEARQTLIRKGSGEDPWTEVIIEPAGKEKADAD